MFDYSSLGQRIKEKRKELNVTQKELAETVEITPQTLSKYENFNGEKVSLPSLEVIIKIADKLNVSIDWLCGINKNSCSIKEKDKTLKPILNNILNLFNVFEYKFITYSINICEQEDDNKQYVTISILNDELTEFFINYNKMNEIIDKDKDNQFYEMFLEALIEKHGCTEMMDRDEFLQLIMEAE